MLSDEIPKEEPLWKWIAGCIFLAFASVCSGTPNLYPTFKSQFMETLNISSGMATFLLTGGVMLLYVTLPAGMFMDKFGSTLTLFISTIVTVVFYLLLIAVRNITWLFITCYFIMSFGSASLFISCLQIALSRSPIKIRGVSASIVSASLSLSFGLWILVFNAGEKIFPKMGGYVFDGITSVAVFCSIIIAISVVIAYFLYRNFPQDRPVENNTAGIPWHILGNYRLYILLFTMGFSVFDGLCVISGGSRIWKLYGNEDAAKRWATPFSFTNCVCTIVFSMVLDLLIAKLDRPRTKIFGAMWICALIFPLAVAIAFSLGRAEALLGVFLSAMGIPFGFGITHCPTMTSEVFGSDVYGFAFGIVQVGSIIASASAMPIVDALSRTGITVLFCILAVVHVALGVCLILIKPFVSGYAPIEPTDTLGNDAPRV